MRKELLWATLIGITFGVVIAFGVWRINSSIEPSNTVVKSPLPSASSSDFRVTLDKPTYGDVVVEETTNVSGITKPSALVMVSGEDEDYLIQSNESGVFNQDVDLIPGVNQIKITAFDPKGVQSVETVLIVFSSSFQLKSLPETEEQEPASSDAEIRQKVETKVQAALNKPKAYLGIVTDITDSTIQIKTNDGEIKQISTSAEDTAVVNTTGITNKTIKLTDIAIGDYLVAMGYINSNSVLNAQRILLANAVTEPTVRALYAKVTTKSKANLTVVPVGGDKEETVTPDKNTSYSNFSGNETKKSSLSEVEQDNLLIYTTTEDSKNVVVRTIFIIDGESPTP